MKGKNDETYLLNHEAREYLIELLSNHYCRVEEVKELMQIEKVYKQLGHESDTWVAKLI